MLAQDRPDTEEPTVEVDAKPTGRRRRNRSAATKLIQAAALAAVLVPLGSVAAEGTSCTYVGGGSGVSSTCGTGSEGGALFTFDSQPYTVELKFEDFRNGDPFTINIADETLTQTDFEDAGQLANFQDYVCVPIAGADNCVQFRFSGDTSPSDTTWQGFFQVYIHWNFLTPFDAESENPQDRIRMLHAIGVQGDDVFDSDISFDNGGNYGPYNPDPGVGGRDDMFSLMAAFQAPDATVPEPASLILLGTGVSTLLYRRRRRNTDSRQPRV